MPLDSIEPGSPNDWLHHASSDLSAAEQLKAPGVLLETLCFHAQQAAEKSPKAVLIDRQVKFPYTHNIARLITIVKESGITWPDELNDASELTDYAVQLRYLGVTEKVTEDDYENAVKTAKAVYLWAKRAISSQHNE